MYLLGPARSARCASPPFKSTASGASCHVRGSRAGGSALLRGRGRRLPGRELEGRRVARTPEEARGRRALVQDVAVEEAHPAGPWLHRIRDLVVLAVEDRLAAELGGPLRVGVDQHRDVVAVAGIPVDECSVAVHDSIGVYPIHFQGQHGEEETHQPRHHRKELCASEFLWAVLHDVVAEVAGVRPRKLSATEGVGLEATKEVAVHILGHSTIDDEEQAAVYAGGLH
mmetsp:Transcript_53196/g.165236  ORF Transcript_53196/g.165236 Transcript_53196/m.165236 type:complete len:227 (-) Transcript_53196:328-1008(-)